LTGTWRVLIGSASGNSSLITISPSLIVFDIFLRKFQKKKHSSFTALFTFFVYLSMSSIVMEEMLISWCLKPIEKA
jgi:hypothetical protein